MTVPHLKKSQLICIESVVFTAVSFGSTLVILLLFGVHPLTSIILSLVLLLKTVVSYWVTRHLFRKIPYVQ